MMDDDEEDDDDDDDDDEDEDEDENEDEDDDVTLRMVVGWRRFKVSLHCPSHCYYSNKVSILVYSLSLSMSRLSVDDCVYGLSSRLSGLSSMFRPEDCLFYCSLVILFSLFTKMPFNTSFCS